MKNNVIVKIILPNTFEGSCQEKVCSGTSTLLHGKTITNNGKQLSTKKKDGKKNMNKI